MNFNYVLNLGVGYMRRENQRNIILSLGFSGDSMTESVKKTRFIEKGEQYGEYARRGELREYLVKWHRPQEKLEVSAAQVFAAHSHGSWQSSCFTG